MSVSRNAAHEALIAWAEWRGVPPAPGAKRYGGPGVVPSVRDDPRYPWRVLCVEAALARSKPMRVAAVRIYLRRDTEITRRGADYRKDALLDYVRWAIDRRYVWNGVLCELPQDVSIATAAARLVKRK